MKLAVLAILCLFTIGSGLVAEATITSGGPGPERALPAVDITGPDPLAEISRYAGRSFDWMYKLAMYKQNSMIACIAALGAYRASSQPLRDLSCAISQEQLALNSGLEWSSLKFTNATKPRLDARRLDSIFKRLQTCTGSAFDRQYVSVLLHLTGESGKAAQRAIEEVDTGQLLAQAQATYRVNSRESKQLEPYR